MKFRGPTDYTASEQDQHDDGQWDLMIDEHRKMFVAAARPDAAIILFCLPYAGAGAGAFRAWRDAFPAAIDVQPIQLPGRENRIADPPVIDPDEVARAIAEIGRAHV